MQRNQLKPENVALYTMIFFAAVLLFRVASVAYNVYLTDSEIWAISSTKLFWQLAPEGTGTLVKPFFHMVLSIPFLFSESSSELFLNARILALLLTIATVAFSAYVIFRLCQSYGFAILTTILICGCYHFILWFPTVRSDSFACLPLLGAAFFIFKSDKNKPWFYIIPMQLMAVAITPKSIFVVSAQYLAIKIIGCLLPRELRADVRNSSGSPTTFRHKRIFIVFLLVFCSMVLLVPEPAQKFISAHFNAADFFINYFKKETFAPGYLSLGTFYYLFRFLIDDFGLSLGVIFSVIYFLICFFKRKFRDFYAFYGLGMYTLLCCLILVFYPDILPFFITSFVPIFSIFLVLVLNTARPLLRLRFGKSMALGISVMIFIFLISITFFNSERAGQVVAEKIHNHLQIDTLDILEKSIPMNMSIYDGIGLFPFRKTAWGYVGPNEKSDNISSLDNIKKKLPDIILLVGRTLVYAPGFTNWVYENYEPISASVWVLKKRIDRVEFEGLKKSVSKLDEELFVLFQFKMNY